jgi:hypothetical protein
MKTGGFSAGKNKKYSALNRFCEIPANTGDFATRLITKERIMGAIDQGASDLPTIRQTPKKPNVQGWVEFRSQKHRVWTRTKAYAPGAWEQSRHRLQQKPDNESAIGLQVLCKACSI